jgi:hypothetical protein
MLHDLDKNNLSAELNLPQVYNLETISSAFSMLFNTVSLMKMNCNVYNLKTNNIKFSRRRTVNYHGKIQTRALPSFI